MYFQSVPRYCLLYEPGVVYLLIILKETIVLMWRGCTVILVVQLVQCGSMLRVIVGIDFAGHSFCYCYNNQLGRRHNANRGLSHVDVHGNTTNGGTCSDRHTFNAMARVLDEGIANVTAALRKASLWNSTLFVFSADNGGAINIAQGAGMRIPRYVR